MKQQASTFVPFWQPNAVNKEISLFFWVCSKQSRKGASTVILRTPSPSFLLHYCQAQYKYTTQNERVCFIFITEKCSCSRFKLTATGREQESRKVRTLYVSQGCGVLWILLLLYSFRGEVFIGSTVRKRGIPSKLKIGQHAWTQAWLHPITPVMLGKLPTLCSLTSSSALQHYR